MSSDNLGRRLTYGGFHSFVPIAVRMTGKEYRGMVLVQDLAIKNCNVLIAIVIFLPNKHGFPWLNPSIQQRKYLSA